MTSDEQRHGASIAHNPFPTAAITVMGQYSSKPILILGSAPHATEAAYWDRSHFSAIVAINNAWRIRPDWDYLIYPEDFPCDRRPDAIRDDQTLVEAAQFVPAINRYGGFIYAGGTMAFTAGYWVLAALRPSRMIFFGCDMLYPVRGRTHFYGQGAADPLRDDPTLRSLEAKSARLMAHAAQQGCACMRISPGDSRLVFPRAQLGDVACTETRSVHVDRDRVRAAETRERTLGYFVESGRYWELGKRFAETQLDAIDRLWLEAVRQAA